jgi:hypothetical protein
LWIVENRFAILSKSVSRIDFLFRFLFPELQDQIIRFLEKCKFYACDKFVSEIASLRQRNSPLASNNCLDKVETDDKEELKKLMTSKFQYTPKKDNYWRCKVINK